MYVSLPVPPPATSFGRQRAEPSSSHAEELYYTLKWWLSRTIFAQPLFRSKRSFSTLQSHLTTELPAPEEH